MSLPATDNFNRANENPLGGNWTTNPSMNGLRLSSNVVIGSTGSAFNGAYWNADSFNDDQYSQAIFNLGGSAQYLSLTCRQSSSQNTSYALIVGTNAWFFQKLVNGTPTNLGSSQSRSTSTGTTIKFAVIGATLYAYFNGVQDAYTFTDTDSPIASGSPGIVIYGNNSSYSVDDWEGGQLSNAAAIIGSGGAIAGGSATISGINHFEITGSGGSVAGGTSTIAAIAQFQIAGSSGAVAGGAAEISSSSLQEFSIAGSGGAVAGGSATISEVNNYSIMGSAGAIAGGFATVSGINHFEIIGSGGSVAGGTSTIEAVARFQIVGSSGAVAGGSADIETAGIGSFSITGIGGGISGGSAGIGYGPILYQVIGEGGAVAGGSADLSQTNIGETTPVISLSVRKQIASAISIAQIFEVENRTKEGILVELSLTTERIDARSSAHEYISISEIAA